jgi:NADP-dependent 3-hydroxy acid dehydrogenase YdfG
MSLGELTGDAALVTGAGSGIGRATALALAREGADVALAARRAERLDAVAEEVREQYGRDAIVVPTDVSDVDAVEALVDRAVDALDGLDVAVVNAGLVAGAGVDELSTDEYRRLTAVNVDGTFFTTRAVLDPLRASGGHLVFVGSYAGQYPRPFNPVYAATKWWTRGFAKSVSAEVGEAGVGVTVINPSEVRTEIEVAGEPFEERFDPGEVTEPEEVAEAVVFAARQSNSMVSELDLFRRDKLAGF